MRIGAIELGGTKVVCGVGDEEGNVLEHVSFPTKQTNETLNEICEFFAGRELAGMGIGSFGPIEVDPLHVDYGKITTTPKLAWQDFGLLKALKERIHAPIYLDTDVNAAALGEARWGAARGLDSCVYMTVGTGIGVGILTEGRLVHGMLHPEVGHMMIRRHDRDNFSGNCPYHGDCLEGLASGPAIAKRWSHEGSDLTDNEAVWQLEAYYLAQVVVNMVLTLSTKKIILGGGVMNQAQLFPYIRKNTLDMLHGYIRKPELLADIDNYIVPPLLGPFAGLKGSMALVLSALGR